MKKVLFAIVALALISCSSNEELNEEALDEAIPPVSLSDIENEDNPMEYVGVYARDAILYVNTTQTENGDDFPSFEEYYENYEDYYTNEPIADLNLDEEAFTEDVRDAILEILDIVDETENIGDFIVEINEKENSIIELYDEDEARIILAFSAFLKYSVYTWWEDGVLIGELTQVAVWEYYFDNCMKDTLNSYNWVQWTEFYTGLPFSAMWLAASCAHEATVKVNNLPD